jgi:hypothetical protein
LGIPSWRRSSRRLAIIAVLVLHVLAGAGLWRYRRAESFVSRDLATAPIMLWPEAIEDEPERERSGYAPPRPPAYLAAPSTIDIPVPFDSEADLRPDWVESARRAAARIAAESPQREADRPGNGSAKPFEWDVSSTRRWEPAPEGGTVVRLSDRCQIVFAPLPIGGCALGKIEARGDLFDDMRTARDAAEGSVPRGEVRESKH